MVDYLHHAPCIYFASTDDGTLVNANQKLCAALGYTPQELIGEKIETIFTLPTRIFQQTHFFPLLKMQGAAEEIFITLRKKDGDHLPVLINAERKTEGEEAVQIYAGIIVHNRKKFEDELIAAKKTAEKALNENTDLVQARLELQERAEALEQQMQLANKQNAELKQFNRVVTHDLQEPLRKMAIFSSMLQADQFKNEHAKIVEKISNVMGKMTSTISGLQKYIWLNETTPNWEVLDAQHIIANAIQALLVVHPAVKLNVDIQGPLQITGDREQMELLFYEVLSNAIQYRKKENEAFVTITSGVLNLNTFRHVAGKYKYAKHLRIQVQDAGIGFDGVYNELVFELFKKLHHKSGRGIGLSLCKKIMDNHQGTIEIWSKEEEGTTVNMVLPLIQLTEPKDKKEADIKLAHE